MRERVRIRRTAPGEWTALRPRLGFGPPEPFTVGSQAEAIALMDRIQPGWRRHGSTIAELERAPVLNDCLNPISPWTPLWIPGTEPSVPPYSHHL